MGPRDIGMSSGAAILATAAVAGFLSDALRLQVGPGLWRGGCGAAYGNVATALVTALGRFGALVPVLAIAGALAAKPRRATTAGTVWTGDLLFLGLLTAIAMVFIAVRLTPALVHTGPGAPVRPPAGADGVHAG